MPAGTRAGSETPTKPAHHIPSGIAQSDFEREPRLAATSGPGQRKEARVEEQPLRFRELVLATDERRELERQIPRVTRNSRIVLSSRIGAAQTV
jgi:hypothetical protein